MSALELLDRNAVLQRRRFDPRLYAVVPAPNCCTVGILFPRRQIPGVVSALSGISCWCGLAKDVVLDDIKRRHRVSAFFIEPNLVKHIGFYFTLRKAATVNPFSVLFVLFGMNSVNGGFTFLPVSYISSLLLSSSLFFLRSFYIQLCGDEPQ